MDTYYWQYQLVGVALLGSFPPPLRQEEQRRARARGPARSRRGRRREQRRSRRRPQLGSGGFTGERGEFGVFFVPSCVACEFAPGQKINSATTESVAQGAKQKVCKRSVCQKKKPRSHGPTVLPQPSPAAVGRHHHLLPRY